MINGFLLFFLGILFVTYLPGRFLLRRTQYLASDSVIIISVSFAVGASLYLFFVYLLKFIGLDLLYIAAAIFVGCIELPYSYREISNKIKNIDFIHSLVIILGVICMSYVTWNSGQYNSDGDLIFYGLNGIDGVWHVSLLENLSQNYPPTHPGLSGYIFRGYNFFYDLFLVNFITYFKLSVYDVYFRYGTVMLALFYGLSCLGFAKFMKMNRLTTTIFLVLMFFAQGFAVSLFAKFSLFYDPGIPQTFAHVIGPNVLFSIALLLPALILIFGNSKRIHLILAAIVIGIIPMVKIYAAVLIFSALGIVTLYQFLRNKNTAYFVPLLLGGLIAAVIYLPLNAGSGSLVFAPYLLYEDFAHRFSDSNTILLWSTLVTLSKENNYLLLVWYKIFVLLGLFYIPSLGVRLFSVIEIKKLFKKDFYSPLTLFFIVFIAIGFLLPSLFIQNIAFFVVLQFIWIIYFVLLIPTAYAWGKILSHKKMIIKVMMTLIFLLLILPDSFNFLIKYSQNPMIIDKDFIRETNFLKTNAHKEDGILVLNAVERNGEIKAIHLSPVVSALSSHTVYYEDEVLEVMDLQAVIKKRKKQIFKVQNILRNCQNTEEINTRLTAEMRNNNNTYIFDMQGFPCLNNLANFQRVSSSGSYSVFKLRSE